MPRKPTLSPTRITTFLACPHKFYWTYLDSKGKYYLRSRSYYSFGSTLHRVLERFYDSRDSGVATTDQVLAAYEESWIDAGYSSAEEMAEAFGEGREILTKHVERVASEDRISNTLFVEKTLRADLGPFTLLGRIDRLEEFPDGTLEIVDYKSGRQEVTVEEVAADIAMSCYQLLVRKNYPGRSTRARIIALRSHSSAAASLTDDDAVQFEDDLRSLGNLILETEWNDKMPVKKSLCSDCDFLALCRRTPGFEGEDA